MFDIDKVEMGLGTFNHLYYANSSFDGVAYSIDRTKSYLSKFNKPFDDDVIIRLEMDLMVALAKISNNVEQKELIRDSMLVDFVRDADLSLQFVLDCIYTDNHGKRVLPGVIMGRAFNYTTSYNLLKDTRYVNSAICPDAYIN